MGLLGTAAKVAVASSVHGRVQRRQQTRWATQDAAGMPAAAPQAVPQAALPATPPAASGGGMLEQLKQLGELRDAGVLTDAEFEAQKARLLAG